MQKCNWLLLVLFTIVNTYLLAHQVEPSTVTIIGKSLAPQQHVEIVVFGDPLMYDESHFRLEYQPDGSFLLNIPVVHATMAELQLGDAQYPIYLEPGKEVSLQIAAADSGYPLVFDSLKTRENCFLSQYTQFVANHNAEIEAFMATATALDYKDFITQMSKNRRRFVGANADYRQSSKVFQDLVNNTEIYWTYNQMLRFAFDKPLFENKWEPLVLEQDYYDFLVNEPVSKAGLLGCQQYLIFLERFMETQKIGIHNKGDNTLEIAKAHLQEEALWYIVAKNIQMQLRNGTSASVHDDLLQFNIGCKHPALLQAVGAMYRKSLGWSVGMQAPAFNLSDASGAAVALEQYRGKAILLDFWATWCGHCRDEMPALQLLGTEYDNMEFEVIFISADKSAKIMGDFVANNGLKGNHLWGDMLRNSKVAKDYQVEALPASFLLDQNGQIVATFTGGTSLNEIRCYLNYLLPKVK